MSSTINRSPEQVCGEIPATSKLGRVRKPLLVCGIASSLLYGAMIWVIRYQGYSPISQTPSELSAWGVSTRPLWIVLGALYDALIIAFAVGVWASASGKRSLRIAAGMLFGYGLLGVAWPFASMHQREVLAAGGGTLADTGHLVLAMVTVVLMFCGNGVRSCRIRTAVPPLYDRDDRDPPGVRRTDKPGFAPARCQPADALDRALGAH